MKKLILLSFAILYTIVVFAQTGSINATTIRAKTTDTTSTVVGTGFGGLRFKNQASQTKWQFTNNGTTWYDLPTNPIRGTLTATAIPYALGVYTLGYENALTYDATLNRVNISNPGFTATSYLLGGEIQLDEPGSTDNITLTVGTASDPSITLLDGGNEQMTIQTDNILLNYIGTGDALDIDITGIARTDSSTPGGDLFKISNLSGDLELETSTVSGSDIILDPLDDLDVQADNANFANTISIRGGSPGSGKVLQSDADGDASWLTPPWIDGSGSTGNIPYFTDANTLANSGIEYNNVNGEVNVINSTGGFVIDGGGSGTELKFSESTDRLDVVGVTGSGAGANKVALKVTSEYSPAGSKTAGFGTGIEMGLRTAGGTETTHNITIENNWVTVGSESVFAIKKNGGTQFSIDNSNRIFGVGPMEITGQIQSSSNIVANDGFGAEKHVPSAADETVYLMKRVVDIGDWNMDATASVNVAHGIADLGDIISVTVLIVNDAGTTKYPLDIFTASINGAFTIDGTNVALARSNGGLFDGTSFDQTSYNRGTILITYLK